MADPTPNPIPTAEAQTAAVAPAADAAPQSDPAPVNKVLFKWQAPEFIYYEKDAHWFVYGGLVALILIISAAIFAQWLMIVVIVVLSAVIYQHARREPRVLDYEITELGVSVGGIFHPYNELKSFWVIYNPPVQVLYIETTRRLLPQIQIQLGEEDPVQVKQVLHAHLPEQEKRTEDWLDAFSRLIRF